MKTKVDIISGFLGAGKTTLIKKLLMGDLRNEKIVVIENEFGKIGIDGNILKESNIEVREINSGCICCTLKGYLFEAIKEIITQYKPDRIIIEPSGVSNLSDVVSVCNDVQLRDIVTINMLITVIDVLRYEVAKAVFGGFFTNHIIYAKTVILSRTQKADNEKSEEVVNSIRRLNNKLNIITTPWEELDPELIISVAEKDYSIFLEAQTDLLDKTKSEEHKHNSGSNNECHNTDFHNHNADEIFEVWGVETARLFNESELIVIFNEIKNEELFGLILRGKGILQIEKNKWVQFDYIPGEIEIKNTSVNYTGRLCIIGRNLNKPELCKLFNTNIK